MLHPHGNDTLTVPHTHSKEEKSGRYFDFALWNAFDIDICLQCTAFLRLKLRNIYVCIRWIYEICVVCFNFFVLFLLFAVLICFFLFGTAVRSAANHHRHHRRVPAAPPLSDSLISLQFHYLGLDLMQLFIFSWENGVEVDLLISN